ncbi:MAG TPA: hypothetical protein HA362_03410 [Nanoarchaeota archaeon]|nr:hypothetical protein [Nanoarchaeota archaeon]
MKREHRIALDLYTGIMHDFDVLARKADAEGVVPVKEFTGLARRIEEVAPSICFIELTYGLSNIARSMYKSGGCDPKTVPCADVWCSHPQELSAVPFVSLLELPEKSRPAWFRRDPNYRPYPKFLSGTEIRVFDDSD